MSRWSAWVWSPPDRDAVDRYAHEVLALETGAKVAMEHGAVAAATRLAKQAEDLRAKKGMDNRLVGHASSHEPEWR